MGEIKKYIKQEDFDRIISMTFLYGKSIEEVAAAIGCGRNTVSSCKQAFKALRDGDTESLISSIGCSNNVSTRIIEMAAASLGMEIPEAVAEALKKRDAARSEKMAVKKVASYLVPAPADPEPVKQPEQHNEQVYFCRLLEELNKHNELMEQLMDVMIPKYIADLKDNLNVNFDTVTQSLKRAEDTLEGIKINTRKRGL